MQEVGIGSRPYLMDLRERIVAQGRVVVEVFADQGNGEDPLAEQGLWVMRDLGRVAGVRDAYRSARRRFASSFQLFDPLNMFGWREGITCTDYRSEWGTEEELDAFRRRLGNQAVVALFICPRHRSVPDELHTSKRIILGSFERTPLASLTE